MSAFRLNFASRARGKQANAFRRLDGRTANPFGRINYLDNYHLNNNVKVVTKLFEELDAIEQWFLDLWAT